MFAQNLFYYTFSIAIIAIAIFICVAVIYCLILMAKIYGVAKRAEKLIEFIKSKVKVSACLGLLSKGVKEVIDIVKEKKKK